MLVYFIHYIIVFLFSLLTVFRKNIKLISFVLVWVALFILAASRGSTVDRDYDTYAGFFHKLIDGDVEYFTWKRIVFYEPCFYLIPFFSKLIVGAKYYIELSFAIFAAIGIYVKLKSFDISNSFFLSVILYLSSYFLLHEMTQVRAGVASGFLLISIRHIYDRKLMAFLLYMLLACSFHYSSIVFLPVYFLNPSKINVRFWIIAIITAFIIAISHVNIFSLLHLSAISVKVDLYSKAAEAKATKFTINIFNYGIMINILLTIIMMLKYKLIATKNKYIIILLKINCLSIICFFALSILPVVAGRISELYAIVQLILYPSIIVLFREKFIGYSIIIFLSMLSFWNYFFHSEILSSYSVWWL